LRGQIKKCTEKGAFTGATQRHFARFESANSGTIFWTKLATCLARFKSRYSGAANPRNQLPDLCSLDQSSRSVEAYAESIEKIVADEKSLTSLFGKKQATMTQVTNKATPLLHKAPQPPLSYPGSAPDSDRAKKPSLAEPSATGPELNSGDRIEGLGNFGVPTGQQGTVERTNEEDVVVKWDNDGRMRLRRPWLKKV
jgi:hypothetical protein